VIYNPTIVGGTWGAVDAESCIEQNLSATGFTGGIVIDQFLISGGSAGNAAAGTAVENLRSRLPFGLDIDGANPVILLIAAQEIDGGPAVSAVVNWDELR